MRILKTSAKSLEKRDVIEDFRDFAKRNQMRFYSAAQNFTISISTTNNLILKDTVGEVNNTAIGLGFRTMLWNGSKIEREEIKKRYDDLRASLKSNARMLSMIDRVNCYDCSKMDFIDSLEVKLLDEFKYLPGDSNQEKFDLIKNLKKELKISLKSNSKDSNDYKDHIDSLFRKDVKYSKLSADLLSLQELLDNRKGFKLEIAGAVAIDFPDNKTNRSFIPQYGVWVTPSYQPSKTNWIEFLGIFKYQGYELDFYRSFLSDNQIPKSSIDVGIKLVLKADKFSFEIETLNRWLDNEVLSDNGSFENQSITDKKNVLRLSYRLSDNLLLSYDFGENFEVPAINNGNLVSLIGLNYGVGQAKKKNID